MDKRERAERIESFRELEVDWDSYGGNPIPDNVVDIALKVNPALDGDYFPSPCPNGNILFESDGAAVMIISHEGAVITVSVSSM